MGDHRHGPAFTGVIILGGLIEGFGLGYSGMARPEIVLDFLQLQDFGLLLVMGSASLVTGLIFFVTGRWGDRAPVTDMVYRRRLRSMDRNVLLGGVLFGIGWGISGICPGAGYASLGVGNIKILWAFLGMFIGAYAQGMWRMRGTDDRADGVPAD